MMRSPLGKRPRQLIIFTGLLALLVFGACNYRWVAVLSTFQFKQMEFVSVFPAHRDAEGKYTRQCGPSDSRKANALMFSVNLVGTEKSGTTSQDKDFDSSMKPGDLVKKSAGESSVREVLDLTSADFKVNIDCVEPYPDADLTSADPKCQGKTGPSAAQANQVEFAGYFGGGFRRPVSDKDAMAIAVMFDQSGSIKGFIDAEGLAEVKPGSLGPWPSNFSPLGTDPESQSSLAVKALFGQLNKNVLAGVFQFSEQLGLTAKIVCDLMPDGTEEERRQDCYGTDRDIFVNSNAYTDLQINPAGRTPLWSAVQDVYNFMKEKGRADVRHILVITDSPDTCHPDSPDYKPSYRLYRSATKTYSKVEQPSCSTVSYDDFLNTVLADIKDPSGNYLPMEELPVHVSFIQLQSVAHPERDVRQQEIACLTGGHYLFVNGRDISNNNTNPDGLRTAINNAVERWRGSMGGTWTVAVDYADLENRGQLPLGANLALAGTVELNETRVLQSYPLPLRIGHVGTTPVPNYDTRGSIWVPCISGDSCDWYPLADPDCSQKACRVADGVCASSWKADDSACDDAGVCCWGSCVEVNECQTRDELCNVTNKADATACTGGVCCEGECKAGASNCTGGSGDPCEGKPDDTPCVGGVCCDGMCVRRSSCADDPNEACIGQPDNTPCYDGVCCNELCVRGDTCEEDPNAACVGQPDNTECEGGVCCQEKCVRRSSCDSCEGAADNEPCGENGVCCNETCLDNTTECPAANPCEGQDDGTECGDQKVCCGGECVDGTTCP